MEGTKEGRIIHLSAENQDVGAEISAVDMWMFTREVPSKQAAVWSRFGERKLGGSKCSV